MVKLANGQISKWSNLQMVKLENGQMFECSNDQMVKWSTNQQSNDQMVELLMIKRSNNQIFKQFTLRRVSMYQFYYVHVLMKECQFASGLYKIRFLVLTFCKKKILNSQVIMMPLMLKFHDFRLPIDILQKQVTFGIAILLSLCARFKKHIGSYALSSRTCPKFGHMPSVRNYRITP